MKEHNDREKRSMTTRLLLMGLARPDHDPETGEEGAVLEDRGKSAEAGDAPVRKVFGLQDPPASSQDRSESSPHER